MRMENRKDCPLGTPLANIKKYHNTLRLSVQITRGRGRDRGRGVFFFQIFLFQFLTLFSCNVIFECSASFLHLWWKLVKKIWNIRKLRKRHLCLFFEI